MPSLQDAESGGVGGMKAGEEEEEEAAAAGATTSLATCTGVSGTNMTEAF